MITTKITSQNTIAPTSAESQDTPYCSLIEAAEKTKHHDLKNNITGLQPIKMDKDQYNGAISNAQNILCSELINTEPFEQKIRLLFNADLCSNNESKNKLCLLFYLYKSKCIKYMRDYKTVIHHKNFKELMNSLDAFIRISNQLPSLKMPLCQLWINSDKPSTLISDIEWLQSLKRLRPSLEDILTSPDPKTMLNESLYYLTRLLQPRSMVRRYSY